MLNRLSDLVRLRTYAATQVRPVARASMDALDDLVPGDTVRAEVEAQLPDGTFRVAIRRQPFLLRLPYRAQTGDTLQLSVVAREPHIKFALAMPDDAPAPATRLSETARFITALLGESEKLPITSIAHAGAPLLAGLPGDGAETAAALRTALAHSGMFYEAHQAQWVAGERALAALMREPQARLAPLSAAGADDADDAPRLPELPAHRDALPMIKQQLDTLETRQVAWHGVIWHGQPLDWEVAEEPRETPDSFDEQCWRTRLRLTLPRLGKLDATLLVAARGITIALNAASDSAAAKLDGARANLQQSLRAAGITALGITVRRDESAEHRQAAVALAYHDKEGAPRVAAKGHGVAAEEIIARARAAGIYVHESPALVALLMQVDMDERIPEELYIAVAELLAWLYRLEHGGAAPPHSAE